MRCLIVDDNLRFLTVVAEHLSRSGLDVVATATNRPDALQIAGQLRPDVVLVDIGLGSDSGFEVTRLLVETFPHLRGRVVLISTFDEDDFVDLIATSPAAGYISKYVLSVHTIFALLGDNGS